MAARINKKFVIGLFGIMALLGIGVAVLVVAFQTTSAQHIALGDEALDAGEKKTAIEHYRKALHKDQKNTELIMKLSAAVAEWPTDDALEARKRIDEMQGLWMAALDQQPDFEPAFVKLMDYWLDAAMQQRTRGDYTVFDAMIGRCDLTLQTRDMSVARLYRAIAQAYRMERIDLTEEQIELARTDLEEAASADPKNAIAVQSLAHWHLVRAARLARVNRDDEAKPHVDAAIRLSTDQYEVDKADPDRALSHVSVLFTARQPEEALPILHEVEKALLAAPDDADQVAKAAQILLRVPAVLRDASVEKAYANRATALLQAGAEAHPGRSSLRLVLGAIYKQQRRFEDAAEIYQRVMDYNEEQLPQFAMRRNEVRSLAKIEYADTLLFKADLTTGEERTQHIETATALIKEARDASPTENGRLDLMEGKLAILDKDYLAAGMKLDQAVSRLANGKEKLMALQLAALAYKERGELGAAADRLMQILNMRSGGVAARLELARIQARLRNMAAANNQLDTVLRIQPDNRNALLLKASILRSQRKYDDALAVLERLNPAEDVQVFLQATQIRLDAGKRQQAIASLNDRFNAQPDSPALLAAVLSVTEDDDKVKSLTKQARDAGMDADMVERIASAREYGGDLNKLIERRIAEADDPYQKAMLLYGKEQRAGNFAAALKYLDEAAKHQPNNAQLIERQFDTAVLAGDLEAAAAHTKRAIALNIDGADGDFFQGNLAMARGRATNAVRYFRSGLEKRQVYSKGWRWLADALRATGDLTNAEDAYRQALSQKPNDLAVLRGLAATLDLRQDHAAALEVFRSLASFARNQPGVYESYLSYEAGHGDKQLALKLRQDLAKKSPDNLQNRRAIALLYATLGQFDQAKRVISQLETDHGKSLETTVTAATVKVYQKQPAEGTKLIETYLRSRGNEASARDYQSFARFLSRINESERSAEAYRQAIAREDTTTRPATREFADLLFSRRQIAASVELYRRLWESGQGGAVDRVVGLRFSHALVVNGRTDEAQKVLDKVIEDHGRIADTLVVQALIHEAALRALPTEASDAQRQALRQKVFSALDEAIALQPRRAATYLQRGQFLAREATGDERAIADLRKALSLQPRLVDPHRSLAVIYARRNEPSLAVIELREVINKVPGDEAAHRGLVEIHRAMNDETQLRAVVMAGRKQFPTSAYWIRLRALLAIQENQPNVAIAEFRSAFEKHGDPSDLARLASLLLEQEKASDALSVLDKGEQLVRRVPVLESLRGRALAELGRKADARSSFRRALDAARDISTLNAVSGQCYLAMGGSETVDLLNDVADANRKTAFRLAAARIQTSDGKLKEALVTLESLDKDIPAHGPDKPNALRLVYDKTYAACLHLLNRYEDAVKAYQAVIKGDPQDAAAMNNLAYILTDELNRPKEALPFAEKAVAANGNNGSFLDTLGWTQFKLGETLEAQRTLQRSVAISRTPLNCYHLGMVLRAMKQPANARPWFIESRKLAEAADDKAITALVAEQLASYERE